jgi:hypothetical protein
MGTVFAARAVGVPKSFVCAFLKFVCQSCAINVLGAGLLDAGVCHMDKAGVALMLDALHTVGTRHNGTQLFGFDPVTFVS